MKPSDQPAQHTPEKAFQPRSAGLYGEVAALPVNRAFSAPAQERKSFL